MHNNYACQFIGGVTPADIGYNERLFLRQAEKQIGYEEEYERQEKEHNRAN